jgi:RNA polymerase sigma-70 factor (ECF subfamily)
MHQEVHAAIDAVYRSDWGRVVASLVRLTGEPDLAEEASQEAFAAALDEWPRAGIPQLPCAWIVRTARNKAIDRIRRRTLTQRVLQDGAVAGLIPTIAPSECEVDAIADDRLRLIFMCCHPSLAADAQVALTLRLLGGLETEEIARAFLVPTATMAQRITRAKRKIRDAGIPFKVPDASDMPSRLDAVLTTVYLIFNEGYSATHGASLVRTDLCAEAIRLARLVRSLMAPQPPHEATGLLALMLLHDSRRQARVDASGDIVLLEHQDRRRWDGQQIAEALPLVDESLRGPPGPYSLQAAIAAVHCRARRAEDTDWRAIVGLYDLLQRVQPTPIVALNRAVAVAMVEGPRAALPLIDAIADARELDGYYLLHAARADLLRRSGATGKAAESYARALELATHESERRFLQRRLQEVRG